MKISIITPSFNQAQFLPFNLSSVSEQKGVHIEHIIVDPGSTDGSTEIARGASGVVLIAEPDRGQSDGINKGFARSTGDILAWLNSDDFYPSDDVLATVAQYFSDNQDVDIVYGDVNFVGEMGEFLRKGFVNTKAEQLLASFEFQVGIVQPGVFWRRRVFEEIGGPSEEFEYCMDYELWARMASKGYKWKYLPKVLAHHRWWAGMKTSSRRDLSLREHFKVCARYFRYVHWKWLDRYAEFLCTKKDGVVNHAAKVDQHEKARSIRQAIDEVITQDMLGMLSQSSDPEKIATRRYIEKNYPEPSRNNVANYPRLLIVDPTPVGSTSATGQIKQVFVDGWPEDRLLQVYEEPSALRLKSWANGGQAGGTLTDSELFAACRQFAPEVLYFRPVDSERLFDFAERAMQDLEVPLVIHMMDDWPERLKVDDPEKFGNCNSALKRLLDTAAGRFSICQKMSDVYVKRYGHEFVPLANGVDLGEIPLKDWSLRPPVTEQRPFVIRYMGGMADDMQFESVADIARTVSALCRYLPVRLEIYTMSWYLEKTKSAVSGLQGVQVSGLVPTQNYLRSLSEADALLIAYNFDAATLRYTSLSMANKLPEVLASGAAVIAYGPTSIATIAYLEKAKCARTITIKNSELLSWDIAYLATNLHACRELGILGRDHVGRFMSKSMVKDQFRHKMTEAARSAKGLTRPLFGSDSRADKSRSTAVSIPPGTNPAEEQPLANPHTPVPPSAPGPHPKPAAASPVVPIVSVVPQNLAAITEPKAPLAKPAQGAQSAAAVPGPPTTSPATKLQIVKADVPSPFSAAAEKRHETVVAVPPITGQHAASVATGITSTAEELLAERSPRIAVIMGNGPSAKLLDFEQLSLGHVASVGMNAAYRYWDRIDFRPTYYICMDTVVILSHATRIVELIKEGRIKKFFLRDELKEAYPEIAQHERIFWFSQARGLKGLFETQFVTTGSWAIRWMLHEGMQLIATIGIDANYVESLPEAKRVGGESDLRLEIATTPTFNPNYFFSDYQREGDKYNVPNDPQYLKSKGSLVHVDSLRKVQEDAKRLGYGAEILDCSPISKHGIFRKEYLSLFFQKIRLPLVTTFRAAENREVLENNIRVGLSNCQNPCVSQVHILLEGDKEALLATIHSSLAKDVQNGIATGRLQFVPIQGRPSYHEIFNYANRLEAKYVAVANSDMILSYRTTTDMIVGRYSAGPAVYALTRWNKTSRGIFPQSMTASAPPWQEIALENLAALDKNYFSYDTYIFDLPILVPQATSKVLVGSFGCDTALAGILKAEGFRVTNPCLAYRTIHVDEKPRDYRSAAGKNDVQNNVTAFKDALVKRYSGSPGISDSLERLSNLKRAVAWIGHLKVVDVWHSMFRAIGATPWTEASTAPSFRFKKLLLAKEDLRASHAVIQRLGEEIQNNNLFLEWELSGFEKDTHIVDVLMGKDEYKAIGSWLDKYQWQSMIHVDRATPEDRTIHGDALLVIRDLLLSHERDEVLNLGLATADTKLQIVKADVPVPSSVPGALQKPAPLSSVIQTASVAPQKPVAKPVQVAQPATGETASPMTGPSTRC